MGTRFQSKTRDGTSPLGHIVGPSEYTSAGLFVDSAGRPRLQDASANIVAGASGVNTRIPTVFAIPVVGAAGTAVEASLLNPLGVTAYVTRAWIVESVKSTAASTADIGVAASSVTSDTLMDGIDTGATATTYNTIDNKGSNGGQFRTLSATSYITMFNKTGDGTGLVAVLYVELVPAF